VLLSYCTVPSDNWLVLGTIRKGDQRYRLVGIAISFEIFQTVLTAHSLDPDRLAIRPIKTK
jgi:hypothetical protein